MPTLECDYESEGFCLFDGLCVYQMVDPAVVEEKEGKNKLICREYCEQWIRENMNVDI